MLDRGINCLKISKIDFTIIVHVYPIFIVSAVQRFKLKRNGPSHCSEILEE